MGLRQEFRCLKNGVWIKRVRHSGCYTDGSGGDFWLENAGGKLNCQQIPRKQIKYFYNMKFVVYLPIVLQVSL